MHAAYLKFIASSRAEYYASKVLKKIDAHLK